MWSKPFIGALEYKNIAYLKSNLQSSTVILNSQQNTFEDIIDEVTQDFINRDRLNREHKDKFKSILLSQHRDHLSLGRAMAAPKKTPISELFSSKHSRQSHTSIIEHFGSTIFKKNVLSRQQTRSEEAAIESEATADDRKQFVKFYVPSHSSMTSVDNQTGHANAQTHHHHSHHNKHIRSTLNLFKNSLHHSKSKNSDLDTSIDIESLAIMIGSVDFLDKPGLFLII